MNKIILSALFGSASLLALSPEQQIYSGGVEMKVAKNALSQKLTGANSIFLNSASQKSLFSQPQTTFKFKTIESKSDLRNELDIFGSSSLSVGNFLSTKEGEFYDNFEMSRDKVYLLIKKDVLTGSEELNQTELVDSAKSLFQREPKSFKSLYGDMFVSKILFGDRYFSLLEIDVSSPQEKSDIEIYLDNLSGVTTESEFQNRISELQSRFRDTDLKVYRDDIDNRDENNSLPFLVRFTPYSSIDGIDIISTEEAKVQNLKEYIVRDQEYENIISKIEYVQDIQNMGGEFFSEIYSTDSEDFDELKAETLREKSRLKGFARDCKKDIECKALSSFDGDAYLEFSTYSELNELLPKEYNRIALNSCAEHQDYFYQDFRDSNYTIEIVDMDSDEHNLSIYCSDMNSSFPQEYLPLTDSSSANTGENDYSVTYLKLDLNSMTTNFEFISSDGEHINLQGKRITGLNFDLTNSDFSFSGGGLEMGENNSSRGYFIHKSDSVPARATNQITGFQNETKQHLTDINSLFLSGLDYQIFKDSEGRAEFSSSSEQIQLRIDYGVGVTINSEGVDLNVK